MEQHPKTQLVDITPELATQWLNKNTHNRPLRPGVVERYADVMKQGKWGLTHQGLAFDENGDLIDGQHRLFAVVESGKTIRMMVTRGLSMKIQTMIDDHSKRSALDVGVVMHGLTGLTVKHIAAARTMWIHGLGQNARLITNANMIDFVRKYLDGISFAVTDVFKNQNRRGITTAPVLALIAQAYYQPHADHDRLMQFGSVLAQGISTDHDDVSALLLRAWLLQVSMLHARQDAHAAYNKVARALYAFLSRERLVKLYEAKEQLFPLPGAKKQPRTVESRIKKFQKEKAKHQGDESP